MPEEINRVLTDHVSTLLFCPTDAAVENLAKEGITQGVHRVGDVMADALFFNLKLARAKSNIIELLGLAKGRYALATVHRAANTDDADNMRSILRAFGDLSSQVVFPVHPRTRKMMNEWGISVDSNVLMIDPVGHFDMLALQENANCHFDRFGGVQKEAYLAGGALYYFASRDRVGGNGCRGLESTSRRARYEIDSSIFLSHGFPKQFAYTFIWGWSFR